MRRWPDEREHPLSSPRRPPSGLGRSAVEVCDSADGGGSYQIGRHRDALRGSGRVAGRGRRKWLPKLGAMRMGVRIDVPGVRWWDYHTVGAGMPMRTAEGGTKQGAMLTRREYLCDASFLVALQGESDLIAELESAIKAPKWTLYLGRKCCPPSRPFLEHPAGEFPDLLSALESVPWRKRLEGDDAARSAGLPARLEVHPKSSRKLPTMLSSGTTCR